MFLERSQSRIIDLSPNFNSFLSIFCRQVQFTVSFVTISQTVIYIGGRGVEFDVALEDDNGFCNLLICEQLVAEPVHGILRRANLITISDGEFAIVRFQSLKSAHDLAILINRHMPTRKNLSKTVIVAAQHACAMVLVGVDRRLPVKILRRFIRQSFLQSVKWATHFRVLIAQIEEKPFVKFSMSGKEVLRLVQGAFVVPPQAGTGREVGLKQFGSSNENVNSQQPAERMSNENSK